MEPVRQVIGFSFRSILKSDVDFIIINIDSKLNLNLTYREVHVKAFEQYHDGSSTKYSHQHTVISR